MKKQILLLLVFLPLFVSAQSFKLTDPANNSMVNNSYVIVNGTATTNDIYKGIRVQNVSGQTLDVKVIRKEINVVAGTLNATCWDICPPADTAGRYPELVSSTTINMADSAIEFSFSAHLYPERNSGCSHMRYIFYGVGTSLRDSVDIYFNHGQTCSPASSIFEINPAISFEIMPNPSQNLIQIYSDQMPASGFLQLTNLQGQMLRTWNLEQNNPWLDLSSFETGLYILTVFDEKNRPLARKKVQILK